MEDLGFNGSGSQFNTRFGSNSPILGKQLNDMSYGIQAGLPQPGVGYGQSIAFTPGGAIFSPETDPNIFGRYQYNADPPQFKCVVFVDPSGGPEQLKYYLKIARGVITASGSKFPFTGGSGLPALIQPGWLIPCQERMIFDVALYPQGTSNPGPAAESQSAWMGSNGKWELDTEVGHYYVTASFLDYDDDQDWYPDETFLHTHEPWISIVKATGESKNNIFTLNTPTVLMQKISLGTAGAGDARGGWGDMPFSIGYGMKVIARIDWKPAQQMWEVRQEMVGPITIDIPFCEIIKADDTNWPGVTAVEQYYQQQLQAKFANDISNFNYIEKFKDTGFTDSDILATEWWYDPKDF